MADRIKKGSVISICTTPQSSELDQTGFEALTYVTAGKVISEPPFGVTENTVPQDYVDQSYTRKFKGFKTPAGGDMTFGIDPDEAGQAEFKTAAGTRFAYAIKIERDDSPDGGVAMTNTVMYGRVLVMGGLIDGGEGEALDIVSYGIEHVQIPVIVDPYSF